MKKIIILIVAILLVNVVTSVAQVSNDQILEIIEQGGNAADIIWPQWIPGIDNSIIKMIVSNIALVVWGFFHRRKTIKVWKEKGKLKD